jgi:hypothetical protein
MSNRRKRQARRRTMTAAERWHAERYRPPRFLESEEIRRIILDDSVARRSVPMTWSLQALQLLAFRERTTTEALHVEMEQACMAAVGLPMPTTGDMSTL